MTDLLAMVNWNRLQDATKLQSYDIYSVLNFAVWSMLN